MSAVNASDYFTDISRAQYIIVQSVCLPIGFFAVFSNAVVLIAYIKYSDMRKLECAHLIAALAFCDLFIGLGIVVMAVSRLRIGIFLWFKFTRLYCIGTSALWLAALEMSQIITASIAIDRLSAMSWPFSYSSRNHRSFAMGAFLVAMFAGFVLLLLSVIGVDFTNQPIRCTWNSSVSPLSAKIFLLFNALIGPFVAILYATALYKKAKWIRNHVGHNVGDHVDTQAVRHQATITKLLTKLVGIYFILVGIPLVALYISITVNAVSFTTAFVGPVANVCLSLNSCVNFFLYAQSSSNLRPFIMKLLSRNM